MNRLFLRAAVAAIALLLSGFAAPQAVAETTILTATHDATLIENGTGSRANGQGPAFFVGNNSQGRHLRGLLRFDVAALPPGSVVLAARLELHMNQSNAGDVAVAVHRVSASWGEGPSSSSGGGGAAAESGDATWIHRFYDGIVWGTPGGDFEPVGSATATVGGTGDYGWEGAGLTADVQGWLDDPAVNHGWIVIGDEGAPQTAKRFDSRESDPALSPRLIVEFAPPCSPAPESQGYWHRQCLGADGGIVPGRGHGPASTTEPGFDALRICAADALERAGLPGRTTCGALDATPPSDPCERAERQLAAMLLNVCSGRLSPICTLEATVTGCAATTVGELAVEIVERIHAGDCRVAAACAAAVNEGDALEFP